MNPAEEILSASQRLARACSRLRFHPPVSFVYNPLIYAREPHEAYLRKYADSRKKVVFLGMNPGPWGMAQTGVPFGEVETVRDWLRVEGRVRNPSGTHPRVPVLGFDCPRNEVSGRRLWGLIRARFGDPQDFFRLHFVANYCPLLFLDGEGRNLTPDKLAAVDRVPLLEACDAHLASIAEVLRPRWMIGVGKFAEQRLRAVSASQGWRDIRIAAIPHPSPASPKANQDWTGKTERVLVNLGVW